MKKILPILFIMILTLGISTAGVAFAEGVTYAPTAETTFKEVVKTYTSENDVVVKETLSFTSTANTGNPDKGAANLTVGNVEVDSSHVLLETDFSENINKSDLVGKKGTVIPVTIPSLDKAGTYEWTIQENKGNTAGVTYNTEAEVHIIVLVGYDNDSNPNALKIENIDSYIKLENGQKARTLNNEFKSGTFTVAKKVMGNMANKNDKFEITVTLTSDKKIGTDVTLAGTTIKPENWTEGKDDNDKAIWTCTSKLNYSEAGGAKTFSDIPVGVTVTVEENTAEDEMNGYTYEDTKIDGKDSTKLTVADNKDAAIVVTNSKGSSIATGISLDSLPYIGTLTAACVGLFLFVSRKRTM